MKTVNVKRIGATLNPDRSRVLIRPFRPNDETRSVRICARIMSLSEVEVKTLLDQVLAEFEGRHQQIRELFQWRFERVRHHLLTDPRQVPNASYEKPLFERKLYELGLTSPLSRRVLGDLPDRFALSELRRAADAALKQLRMTNPESEMTAKGILLLAESNYEVRFSPESRLSERVIFPTSPSQTNGIEDARFVRFQNEDGTHTYYATYTAYDGKLVLPQLLET